MKRLLVLLVALATAATACTNATEPYAAKVNGQVIEAQTIDKQVQSILSSPRYAEILDTQLLQGVGGLRPGGDNTINAQYTAGFLYDRIMSVLIGEEIAKQKIDITPQTITDTEARLRAQAAGASGDQQTNIFDTLEPTYRNYVIDVQAKVNALLAKRSNPEAQRAYYEANAASFEQVCFRQTNAGTSDQVRALKARVANGEDFAAVARESFGAQQPTDASGQPVDPGQPTCVVLNSVGPGGRQILDPLAVNSVSDLIPTSETTFVIIQIASRAVQPFEAVQASIADRLGNQSTLYDDLLSGAEVEVNPRYGRLQRPVPASGQQGEQQQQQPGVYPLTPVAPQLPSPNTAAQPALG